MSQQKKELHIKVKHQGPKKFTCPDCGHQSNRAYDLKVHRNVHKKKDINCIECGKKMKDKYRAELHMAKYHTIGEYSCPVCQKTFPIKYNLILHKKTCLKASNKQKLGYSKNTNHPSTSAPSGPTAPTRNIPSDRGQPRMSEYEIIRANNIAERMAQFKQIEEAAILAQISSSSSQNIVCSSSQEPDAGDCSSLEPANTARLEPTRPSSPRPANSSTESSPAQATISS